MLMLATASTNCARGAEVNTAPALVRGMLEQADHPLLPTQETRGERDALRVAYEHRGFDLLWRDHGEVSRQANALLKTLRSAEAYGLRPTDYGIAQLDNQLAGLAAPRKSTPEQWARFDLMLSAAVLRFVTQVHFGRVDPKACGFHLAQPRPKLDTAEVLEQLATTDRLDEVLASFEPPFLHYRLLKQALARYRALAADPGLTKLLSVPGRSLKPGDSYADAPALRRLLTALGDLAAPGTVPASDDRVLDPQLIEALERFQRRHGLDTDGALGQATFAALTTPLEQRVRQIEITLERWRWLPPVQTPPIIVNIPQFKLFAFKSTDDRAASLLQMPVIVGQAYAGRRTPVFIGDMKYVVFRPYWDVPTNILKRELLPAIRANPAYLQRQNFEIVRGQGDDAMPLEATAENIGALAAGRLRLRQRPGNDNALGLVKFMFPNDHNVYLHSTPARQLFQQPRRAFSHGCIRVSDPVGLAAHVLRDTPGEWTPEKIATAMNGSKTLRVNLSMPISVMILYATAVATEAGDVLFFEDLYGHDRKVETLLRFGTASGPRP
jgi:murein L,D-transpeptidase YcbB/YkuD